MRWLKTLRPALPAAAAWCGLTILPQFLPAAAPTTPLTVRPPASAQQPSVAWRPKVKKADQAASAESLFPGATVVTDANAAITTQDGERPLEGVSIAPQPGVSTVSDIQPSPVARPAIDTLSDDSASDFDLYPRSGVFHFSSGVLRVRQPAPVTAEQPIAPQTQAPTTTAQYTSPFGGGLGDLGSLASLSAEGSRVSVPADSSAADFVVGGQQSLTRASNDVGTLIQDSPQANNISLFRRPMMSEPHVRGYHQRQIYTQLDGGYWIAARWDMDTIVSKIDSGIVEDVIIIKGPYSALYGPTLSVIDVVTVRTPRNCCGLDIDARTVLNYDTNGEGWYARQAFSGGAENYGFRISTGFRTANDYDAGDDIPILGSYKHRDIDAAFGYDLDCDARVEFKYVRLDLTDAELHNQPTDIGFLVTNGFTGRFEWDNTGLADHVVLDGWYNRTRIGQGGFAFFEVVNPVGAPVGALFGSLVDQYADQISTGTRLATTWGDKTCSHLTVGADYRHINQQILEEDLFAVFDPATPPFFFFDDDPFPFFDLPVADSHNPGLFAQATDNLTDSLKLTLGGRLDHVSTSADATRLGFQGDDRNFDLYSLFVTGEYQLNCEWTLTAGVGHGQRPPTLTELYVDGTFIAGMQDGANFYTGNDQLREEQATQVDIGVNVDYCNLRSARAFYTWVDDYITYLLISDPVEIEVPPPGPAGNVTFPLFGYTFLNTSYATLAGFEVNGEYDLTRNLTAFGQIAYTEGRDQEINEPLFGIYPLQSRAGLRLENRAQRGGYGVEFAARIVDDQDRIASSLGEFTTPGFTTYDIRTFYRFSEQFMVTGGVENLSDKLYFEHFDYQIGFGDKMGNLHPTFQRGRNFYVGLEARY